MKHKWLDHDYGDARDLWHYGRRRCTGCGSIQQKEDRQSWGRVIGYQWWPLAGRCTGKKVIK